MVTILPHPFSEKIGPILGAIKSTGVREEARRKLRQQVLPFVTISQLPGAGGKALAEELGRRLNAIDPAERNWEVFDRQQVETAASDDRISRELIESLEESSHTWLTEFFAGLSSRTDEPSDLHVFHKLAGTIRALAQAGRVVLLGWGAGYITSGMPGGTHVWLVADADERAARLAQMLGIDLPRARSELKVWDQRRTTFYKRYWPTCPLGPEQFTLTLNASGMSVAQMAAAITGALFAPQYLSEPVVSRRV